MECITIYKKDLKYYMFILYVIHNFRHKGINVVFNTGIEYVCKPCCKYVG